jgi:hypothetical protein
LLGVCPPDFVAPRLLDPARQVIPHEPQANRWLCPLDEHPRPVRDTVPTSASLACPSVAAR